MKKLLALIVSATVLLASGMLISGCTPEQIKAISKTAGKAAAAGWIAKENPGTNEVIVVKNLLAIIKTKAENVQQGSSYFEVIYPEIKSIIDAQVDPKYRIMCMLGASSILDGIDLLFALHPEWESSEEMVLSVVNSFIDGADGVLGLPEKDPTIQRLKRNAKVRDMTLKS